MPKKPAKSDPPKKTTKNAPPKKQEKAGGELIFQGQDAFTAMCIIDGHLSKVNAARKAAGEPEPLQAYFTTPKQLQDFLLDVFVIAGETPGNRRGNLGFYLETAKYRTGEDIPWTRSGAIAYWLKAFPHSEFTPGGKTLAQDLGVIPDWLKAGATPGKGEIETQDGPRQTWVKQLKVKGAKWEDLCITVAPGGTVVVFLPTGQKIIETWDPGFLTRREGRLLQDFQLTATLKGEKNHVSILRTALKKAAGISEDPFLCEGGQYTRRFSMGPLRLGTGAVSEHATKSRRGRMSDDDDDDEGDDPREYFGDGYHIESGPRR